MASAPPMIIDLEFDPLVAEALKESLGTLAMVCELANGLAARMAAAEREIERLKEDVNTLYRGEP